MNNPRYQRLMNQLEPIPVTGQHLLTQERLVLWRNVCLIGDEMKECIVEMSKTKLKFFIVVLELEIGKFHVIEMWKLQANKLIKACGDSIEHLMTYLEFKFGVLQIKDYDLLIQYQLYQSSNTETFTKKMVARHDSQRMSMQLPTHGSTLESLIHQFNQTS
jgi:hypothetical protein